eukprot:6394040-Ditylum_brightwellii.AAC.1
MKWITWEELEEAGTSLWFMSLWWVDGSTGWIDHFLELRDSKGLSSLDNIVLLSPKLGALCKGKSKLVVVIPHGMQDVISHFMEKGFPGAPKEALRHVLHFEKLGRAIGALPHLDIAGNRGWRKFMGAVHPDGLLSNLKLNTGVIAPGPSASGWM